VLALAAFGVNLASAQASERPTGEELDERQTSPRLVLYYQTQYVGGSGDDDPGTYVSPLPLADHGATHVYVAAIHLNDVVGPYPPVTLNDHAPDHPRYDRMWADLATLQKQGVRVLGMVGGAAPGTFDRLDHDFETYYPLLRDTISRYHLDGVDLDVEQPMSQEGVQRLIDALRADFGPDFLITLAPVAPALRGGDNLSGFDYDELYAARGDDIAWFNTQFYCGWGLLDDTEDYDRIIRHGVVPPSKVVAGTLTNPANCGSGYVDLPVLTRTIRDLKAAYPDFGGIMGWEYFNSLPGGTDAPWIWAQTVRRALDGARTPSPASGPAETDDSAR